jgi:hypothetical protein
VALGYFLALGPSPRWRPTLATFGC